MAESVSLHEMQASVPRSAEAAARVDRSARGIAEAAAGGRHELPVDSIDDHLLAQLREAHRAEDTSAEEVTAEESEGTELKKRMLEDSISSLDSVMENFSKSVRFFVFEESGELYAQVVNTETDEVIRSIPSEEALEMMSRIHDVLGMMVDAEG